MSPKRTFVAALALHTEHTHTHNTINETMAAAAWTLRPAAAGARLSLAFVLTRDSDSPCLRCTHADTQCYVRVCSCVCCLQRTPEVCVCTQRGTREHTEYTRALSQEVCVCTQRGAREHTEYTRALSHTHVPTLPPSKGFNGLRSMPLSITMWREKGSNCAPSSLLKSRHHASSQAKSLIKLKTIKWNGIVHDEFPLCVCAHLCSRCT